MRFKKYTYETISSTFVLRVWTSEAQWRNFFLLSFHRINLKILFCSPKLILSRAWYIYFCKFWKKNFFSGRFWKIYKVKINLSSLYNINNVKLSVFFFKIPQQVFSWEIFFLENDTSQKENWGARNDKGVCRDFAAKVLSMGHIW